MLVHQRVPTKMPYVWRSSFPIDSFCSSQLVLSRAKRPRPLAALRTALRMLSSKGHMAATHVARVKLRNSALNPGVRRIKIAQTIQNMSKYPHIQVCKKYVQHDQTVGDCTCGIFGMSSLLSLGTAASAPCPLSLSSLGYRSVISPVKLDLR